MMNYKGYIGKVEFDDENLVFLQRFEEAHFRSKYDEIHQIQLV